MAKVPLSGFVTQKELCAYLGFSDKTFRKKTKHLQPFLKQNGKRKRLYSPDEWEFILKNLA